MVKLRRRGQRARPTESGKGSNRAQSGGVDHSGNVHSNAVSGCVGLAKGYRKGSAAISKDARARQRPASAVAIEASRFSQAQQTKERNNAHAPEQAVVVVGKSKLREQRGQVSCV